MVPVPENRYGREVHVRFSKPLYSLYCSCQYRCSGLLFSTLLLLHQPAIGLVLCSAREKYWCLHSLYKVLPVFLSVNRGREDTEKKHEWRERFLFRKYQVRVFFFHLLTVPVRRNYAFLLSIVGLREMGRRNHDEKVKSRGLENSNIVQCLFLWTFP